MRISRTVVTLAVWVIALVVNNVLGIDINIVPPEGGDSFTVMDLLNWVLPIVATYFRVKAKESTNVIGIKTGAPLE